MSDTDRPRLGSVYGSPASSTDASRGMSSAHPDDPTQAINPSASPTQPINPSASPTQPINPSASPTQPINPSASPTQPMAPSARPAHSVLSSPRRFRIPSRPISTRQRAPRGAHPWPYPGQWWSGLMMGGTAAAVALFMFVTSFQGDDYAAAGAGSPEAGAGAVFAEFLVLGLLITTGVLYRLGYPLRQVGGVGASAVAVALFFALLPNLTSHANWLTTVLGVVISLVYNTMVAIGLAALARYVPLPSDPVRDPDPLSDPEPAAASGQEL